MKETTRCGDARSRRIGAALKSPLLSRGFKQRVQGSTESRPTWFAGRISRKKISRIEPLNLVGMARRAVRAASSGATMPPAASRAGTSQRDVPTQVRFMEREHLQKLDASWGHEPR